MRTHRTGTPISIEGREHLVQGVQVVLLQERTSYLQFRLFPLGWELPGGHIDPGETVEEAACREVEEEAGCPVVLDMLVGLYSWQGLRRATDAVYLGHIVTGTPHRTIEAIRYGFYPQDALPRMTFPWVHRRIEDALRAHDDPVWRPIHREQWVTPLHVFLFGCAWLLHPVDRLIHRGGGTSG